MAKGIGIILVVVGHVLSGLVNSRIIPFEGGYYYLFSIIYSFHMPLFFFLSGLTFFQSLKKKPSVFLVGKVDTVLYPYVIWSLLQGVTELLFSSYTNHPVSVVDILSLWYPRDQFWFLYALFLFLIFSFFIRLCFKGLAVYVMLFISVFLWFLSDSFHDIFLRQLCFNYAFFTLGALASCFHLDKHIGELSKWCLGIIVLFVFVEYIYLVEEVNLRFFIACLGVLCVLCFSFLLKGRSLSFLSYVGRVSLEIYVMHIFFSSGIRIIFTVFDILDSGIGHVIIGIVVGLFAPLVLMRYIISYRFKFLFTGPFTRLICKER